MDRKLKKAINLKITQILDSKCALCEYRLEKNRATHCNEYCPVLGELQEYSSMLVSDEKKKVISKQENQFNKGRWSMDDEFYLIHHVGLFSNEHLAKKLNRSPKDLNNKIYRLKITKRIPV